MPGQAKKKWSKGKTREKVNNAVIFDKETYDRLYKEVPKMKLITVSGLVDRLKINGSAARMALKELHSKGLIKEVCLHSKQLIYTKTQE